jgi:cytochrome P450
MTAHVVHELELPLLNTVGMERLDAIAAIEVARSQHWLAKTEMGYSVTRLEDVTAVLRDKRFHSGLSILTQMNGLPAGYTQTRRQSILSMEGDGHARLRRLVAPAFTPASASRLRPTMRAVVNDLFDKVAADGHCEFVTAVCEPYPIPIICELLGAPPEDWKLFSSWATDIFRIFNGSLEVDFPLIERANAELTVLHQRHGRRPPDRAPRRSAQRPDRHRGGGRPSLDRGDGHVGPSCVDGGNRHHPQSTGLQCIALFADHPDQWALLAERPELAPRAVEESMRYLGAVRATVRFASEDITYRDVLFPRGTIVSTALAGANRDPDVWEFPEPVRHHQGADHGADDLRGRHPLLHGCRAGPGRVAGGPAAAGPPDARTGPERSGGVETGHLRDLGACRASGPL